MSAKSKKQRRFFYLVKALQEGKISSKVVGNKINKAANSISTEDVNNFTRGKSVPRKKLEEIIQILKESIEPVYLENDVQDTNVVERNPVAKTFQQKGNFEQYVDRFSGLELKSKELEAVSNHIKSKPTKMDKFSVRYESTDEFNNNTITVIKKLREGNDLVFTVFQTMSQQAVGPDQQSGTEEEILVNKSVSFRDEINGGNLLSDLLQKLEI
jgi:hypothetical protein